MGKRGCQKNKINKGIAHIKWLLYTNKTPPPWEKAIRFNTGLNLECSERKRNPRNTNWEDPVTVVIGKLPTPLELEANVEDINSCLTNAFRENCSLGRAKRDKDAPWCIDQMEKLRKATRRLFNKAKREGNWDAYRKKLAMYNHEIRRAKRRNYRTSCEAIVNTCEGARLHRATTHNSLSGKHASNGWEYLGNGTK